MKYVALWFNGPATKDADFEFFGTRALAEQTLEKRVQDYLESGERPPRLEDWFTARVVSSPVVKQRPSGYLEIRTEEEL